MNRDVFRRGDEVVTVDYDDKNRMTGATRSRPGGPVEVTTDKAVLLSWLTN